MPATDTTALERLVEISEALQRIEVHLEALHPDPDKVEAALDAAIEKLKNHRRDNQGGAASRDSRAEGLAAISKEGMDFFGRFCQWNQGSRFEDQFVEKISAALACPVKISPNAYGRPDGIVIPVLIPREYVEAWLAQTPNDLVHAEHHEGTKL